MTFLLSCTSKIDKVHLGREYYGVCEKCDALHPNDTITYTPMHQLKDGKYYTEISYKGRDGKEIIKTKALRESFFLYSSIKLK